MRISAELVERAEVRINPNLERELSLRGFSIPAIENMAATRDGFDAWDLSNNRIVRLENLPRLERLKSMYCSGNIIEAIDARNIKENAPNLHSLTLSDNNISSLREIVNIGEACSHLEDLSLIGNPVTRQQHYRLYTISRMPKLRVLDFVKVTRAERSSAERLVQSTAGATLEMDVQSETRRATAAQTFTPGEGQLEEDRSFATTTFTAEQKEMIRNLLSEATSVKEVEDIENSVRRGILPKMGRKGLEGVTANYAGISL